MPDLTLNASPLASQAFANITLFDSLIQSDLGDPQLRMYGWEQLKERAVVGPLNIPMMMRQVEQMALACGKPLLGNVNELFEKFAANLSPEFEIAQIPEADRQINELQLNALQERLREHYENTALETMWDACLLRQFQDQGAFAQEAPPSGHQAIREWLNNPVNQLRIQQITEFGPESLGLIGLGLRALPPEIGLFTGLTTLNLFNNQLSFIPESLGNLQALSTLDLQNNQLASLPKSLGNLQALSALFLSNNQLVSLPKAFGNLQALTWLHLSNNPLVSLPKAFGNLQALSTLFLSNNQLVSLPKAFGNLQALSALDLSNNQLVSLPKAFGNLQALSALSLSNNQLVSLPEPLGNLQVLTWLDLNANPLMLASNKECNKIKDYQTYLAQLEPLKKYAPQSPLAIIFKTIIFQQPVEMIQEAYAQLSPDMQLRIATLVTHKSLLSSVPGPMGGSSASDPSLSQDILFTDMGLFARSVRRAAFDHFESLPPDQKNGVYYHIWDLAGRPETDETNWGEHHMFDHVLRFVDALERATTN